MKTITTLFSVCLICLSACSSQPSVSQNTTENPCGRTFALPPQSDLDLCATVALGQRLQIESELAGLIRVQEPAPFGMRALSIQAGQPIGLKVTDPCPAEGCSMVFVSRSGRTDTYRLKLFTQ